MRRPRYKQKAEQRHDRELKSGSRSRDGREVRLPDFPWPPPIPSAVTKLAAGTVAPPGRALTLRAVADKLETALKGAQYEYSFYAVPAGGFALVARFERVTEEGEAVAGDLRFLPGRARAV